MPKKRLIQVVVIILIVIPFYIAIIFFVIKMRSGPYIYSDLSALPKTQTALILGASVSKDGTLSPILQDRASAAVDIYNAHKVKRILVSGDNSTTTYNEVNPVKTYLVLHGVPAEDIFLDYAGFDTYSSMYRARDIFLVGSTTIVSQSFHLPRAVFIARNLTIDAYGYSADDGHYLLRNYIREWLANGKAVYNLLLSTKPKYLGETIPVKGKDQNPY